MHFNRLVGRSWPLRTRSQGTLSSTVRPHASISTHPETMSSHSSPSEIERKVDIKPPRPHRTPKERLDEVHDGGEESEVIDLCSSPIKPKISQFAFLRSLFLRPS